MSSYRAPPLAEYIAQRDLEVLRQTDDVRGAQTPDAQQPQQRVAADLEDAAEKHEARARHWTMWARVTHAAQTGNQVHDLALAAEHAATARGLRNTAAALCRPSTRGRNETATEPAAEPAVERRPDSPKVPRTLDEAIKAILGPGGAARGTPAKRWVDQTPGRIARATELIQRGADPDLIVHATNRITASGWLKKPLAKVTDADIVEAHRLAREHEATTKAPVRREPPPMPERRHATMQENVRRWARDVGSHVSRLTAADRERFYEVHAAEALRTAIKAAAINRAPPADQERVALEALASHPDLRAFVDHLPPAGSTAPSQTVIGTGDTPPPPSPRISWGSVLGRPLQPHNVASPAPPSPRVLWGSVLGRSLQPGRVS